MLAEEGHYRAGGLAPVVPMLAATLMLHESAVVSTRLERTPGVGAAVVSRYGLTPADTIFVFSNSGVNAVPVEVALTAKEAGATVIAIVALDYAATVAPGPTGRKLADIADIVLNNHGVPGDALVAVQDTGLRTGPGVHHRRRLYSQRRPHRGCLAPRRSRRRPGGRPAHLHQRQHAGRHGAQRRPRRPLPHPQPAPVRLGLLERDTLFC